MKQIKAVLFLILFCSSTVSSFASVHSCEGEITDIDIIGLASCDHVEKVDRHCASHCCDSDESNSENDKEDCCTTSELGSSHNNLKISQEIQLIDVIASVIVYSNFTYLYQHVVEKTTVLSEDFSIPITDILVVIQCFRI